jgi:peroxiredoxin
LKFLKRGIQNRYMKQFIYILLLVPIISFGQTGRFTITGTVTNLSEGTQISLSDVNNPADTIAKAKLVKGSFILKGTVQEPNLYYLNLDAAKKKVMLFIGNDNVTVTGDASKLQEIQVAGSSTHKDFVAFQETFNPKFQQLSALSAQINGKPGISQDDTLLVQYQDQLGIISNSINQFIGDRKASPVSPFLILVTSELEQDPVVIAARMNQLDSSVRNNFYGRILQEQMDKRNFGAVGTKAIEFTQNDTTGRPVSLASFRGKYVLLDFWASWCKPCRMENPNVVTAFNKFKDKNFTVLGISLDRSRDSWINAIKEDQLAWTHVSDLKFWSNDVAVKYRIESIPQNYLIDPEGKIIAKNLRGDALQSRLCDLLGCN